MVGAVIHRGGTAAEQPPAAELRPRRLGTTISRARAFFGLHKHARTLSGLRAARDAHSAPLTRPTHTRPSRHLAGRKAEDVDSSSSEQLAHSSAWSLEIGGRAARWRWAPHQRQDGAVPLAPPGPGRRRRCVACSSRARLCCRVHVLAEMLPQGQHRQLLSRRRCMPSRPRWRLMRTVRCMGNRDEARLNLPSAPAVHMLASPLRRCAVSQAVLPSGAFEAASAKASQLTHLQL